jgi:hypothetical protein
MTNENLMYVILNKWETDPCSTEIIPMCWEAFKDAFNNGHLTLDYTYIHDTKEEAEAWIAQNPLY